MGFNLDKLAKIAKPRSKESETEALYRKENSEWLHLSQDIALNLHYYLRRKQISQKEFADKLGVSAAYVGKLLKGKENLTLETICRLQKAIGIELVSVSRPYEYNQVVIYKKIVEPINPISSTTYSGRKTKIEEFCPFSADVA